MPKMTLRDRCATSMIITILLAILTLGIGACAPAPMHGVSAMERRSPPAAVLQTTQADRGAAHSTNGADTTQPTAFRPQIVYTAQIGLQADDVGAARDSIEQTTADLGGYIGSSSNRQITARVPADRFNEALAAFELFGRVTDRRVTAEDVTDRVVDLESRLRNSEAMRDRLLAMIDRAQNMEAALKIEQELHRVMEQIELIEGRLRMARQQVAYATITVSLTRTPDEERIKPAIPIVWVRELGEVLEQRQEIDVTTPTRLRDGVRIDLPESFIRYYQMQYITHAIDAEGVRIRVRRQQNFDEGRLAFWSELIARSLRENAGLTLVERMPVSLYRNHTGSQIAGTKRIGGRDVQYLIVVAVTDDHVFTFEAWGEGDAFERVAPALSTAISTMRVD